MVEKVKTFLKEVQKEMSAMTWPTPSSVAGSTLIVIVTSILLGIFVGIVDKIMMSLITILVK